MTKALQNYLAAEVRPFFTGGKSYMAILGYEDMPESIREEMESLGVDCRVSSLSAEIRAIVLTPAECDLLDITPETDAEGYARSFRAAAYPSY